MNFNHELRHHPIRSHRKRHTRPAQPIADEQADHAQHCRECNQTSHHKSKRPVGLTRQFIRHSMSNIWEFPSHRAGCIHAPRLSLLMRNPVFIQNGTNPFAAFIFFNSPHLVTTLFARAAVQTRQCRQSIRCNGRNQYQHHCQWIGLLGVNDLITSGGGQFPAHKIPHSYEYTCAQRANRVAEIHFRTARQKRQLNRRATFHPRHETDNCQSNQRQQHNHAQPVGQQARETRATHIQRRDQPDESDSDEEGKPDTIHEHAADGCTFTQGRDEISEVISGKHGVNGNIHP